MVIPMKRTVFCLLLLMSALPLLAQTHARMMLWDSHERHPLIWQVEFDGADSLLATYDAIYGHGPMLENDTYALRVYAQPWPRIDLYGKSGLKGLELPETAFYTTPQQLAQGYGADALYVGPSIGVGSLLPWDGNKSIPFSPVERRGQRVVYSTADSCAVEVYVKGFQFQGQSIDLVQRLSMRRGDDWTQVDAWITGSKPDSLTFCTGIQRMQQDLGHLTSDGKAETWGSNAPEKDFNVGVRLYFEIDKRYIVRQLDAEMSTLYIVRARKGHLRYRVKATTTLWKRQTN